MPIKPRWDERVKIGQKELDRDNSFTKDDIKNMVSKCLRINCIKGKVLISDIEKIKHIYEVNEANHIIWIQFASTGHVAVVGAGKDIGFPHNEKMGTWKILSKIKKDGKRIDWDRSEVIIIPIEGLDSKSIGIKNVTNVLHCRNGVEQYIGEFLISSEVPILNYYSHRNYTDTFWKKCKRNNYDKQ